MLPAQRNHQLLVRLFFTALVQHAHVRLSPIQRLAGFPQATCQAVVNKRELQDTLQSLEDGHLRRPRGGGGGDFDFIGAFGRGGGRWLFSVRLFSETSVLVGCADGMIDGGEWEERGNRIGRGG